MPESPRATTGGALPPRAVAVMLLLCLVWGLNLVAIKLGNAGIPPVLQAGLRSVIATAVLFGWCASRGGGIGAALALRLASFALLRADGMEPVLVLDDVFAELDSTRRERLAGGVLDAEQVLVTAAVGADVPDVLQGRRFRVAAGEVTRDA